MTLSTKQKWLIIGVETLFFVALAAWVLVRFDRIFEPVALLVTLVIVVVGDVITALLMERFAPTRITLEPGEGSTLVAHAINDFDKQGHGRVLLRGERWRAYSGSAVSITAGTKIRVLSRTGLVLHVETLD